MGSLPLVDDVNAMSDDDATPNSGSKEADQTTMSDEQIEIMALTVSDVSAALNEVSPNLAKRIREQQEDVADTRRQAQVNEDLLRLRVS